MAHSFCFIKAPISLKTLHAKCLYTRGLLNKIRWVFAIKIIARLYINIAAWYKKTSKEVVCQHFIYWHSNPVTLLSSDSLQLLISLITAFLDVLVSSFSTSSLYDVLEVDEEDLIQQLVVPYWCVHTSLEQLDFYVHSVLLWYFFWMHSWYNSSTQTMVTLTIDTNLFKHCFHHCLQSVSTNRRLYKPRSNWVIGCTCLRSQIEYISVFSNFWKFWQVEF